MKKDLIIRPEFKDSKENPNVVIHYVDEKYIIKEVHLDLVTKELSFKVVKKPKKVKPKKKVIPVVEKPDANFMSDKGSLSLEDN